MASGVTPPRGMRDFVPRDKRMRERVLVTIASRYRAHGFEPIETPVMEDHETLHAGLGGDNEKLAFGVLRRGLSLDDVHTVNHVDELVDLGLRFDLTVPLARFVASHHAELPEVFRALHVGPVWRAERPQKGRFRQFVQCDIDIVGEPGSLAEQEVLLATADALGALGLSGWRFRINDRRLLRSALTKAAVVEQQHLSVLITLDKLDKVGHEGVIQELTERHPGGVQLEVISELLEHSSRGVVGWDPQEISALMGADIDTATSVTQWAGELQRRLGEGRVVFDPLLVRGMGYYTGSIVELEHPQLGVSLGGGGRYDGMVGRFLGTDLPAFGFSLGFERLMDVIEPDSRGDTDSVAILWDPAVDPATLIALKLALVADGLSVSLYPAKRNLKAQIASLELAGCRRFAQIGPDFTPGEQPQWREIGGAK